MKTREESKPKGLALFTSFHVMEEVARKATSSASLLFLWGKKIFDFPSPSGAIFFLGKARKKNDQKRIVLIYKTILFERSLDAVTRSG